MPTTSPRTQLPETVEAPPARDWFLAAIEADGSVGDCLQAVLDELAARSGFVTAVRTALQGSQARGPDAVTDLLHRIRALENTLRFRIGVLRADRPLAWFRAPAATSTGPFASTLIDEAIFGQYDVGDAERVRRELGALWAKRAAGPLPFRDAAPNLWRTLLGFNAELARLSRLGPPFDGLSLDRLPEGLPPSLESRALRAFLVNVRNEILAARERLTVCFNQLWEACEKLWAVQIEQAGELRQREREKERERERERVRSGASAGARASGRATADTMREEFKKRRQTTGGTRQVLSAADRDALRFMGFEDVPSIESLRQRYLAMAKKLHPDLQGGNDGAFKILSNAYSHLSRRLDPANSAR